MELTVVRTLQGGAKRRVDGTLRLSSEIGRLSRFQDFAEAVDRGANFFVVDT
jgi:hypothetical protein